MDTLSIQVDDRTYLIYRELFAPVKSNMYVFIVGNMAVVFDPCVSYEIQDLLEEKNVKHVDIFLTHEHFDHTSGVNWLSSHFKSSLHCQKKCAESIAVERRNNPSLVAMVLAEQDKKDGGSRYKSFMELFNPYTCKTDDAFDKEKTWMINELLIKGVSTPGHSPGSCFYFIDEKLVLSGDSLLKDNKVITVFRYGSQKDYNNITLPFIKSLNSNYMVLPGHGEPFVINEAKHIE